jgi:hypothetical protein
VLQKATGFTAVTHNQPEGIKDAKATAIAIFPARNGKSKAEIKDYIETTFECDLGRNIDDIRLSYTFDISCQGTVPQAIRAFIDSTDFEDAIRNYTEVSVRGNMDDWCDQQDTVSDGDRIYRCSKCGKRLYPRKIFGSEGELAGFRLPPHKKKGHRIMAIKRRQHRIRTGK